MKITVITGKTGKVVGAFHGHREELKSAQEGPYAIPMQGPEQTFHEIEVPDDVFPVDATPEVLAKFPERVTKHLRG